MTLAKAITKTLDIDVEDVKIDLTATIKSYDLTDTKFIFDIQSSKGLSIDLTGGTAMYIVEYVHNSKTYAIQGDITLVNSTKISFNLPEDLKGYKGTVLIGLYVRLTDGTKIDIKDIAVRIEPSIMDKGIDFTAKTYFEDFETVKAEVISKGEQVKTAINGAVSDVNGYADSQKQIIHNTVVDVQSTGNKAKADINAVLPTVQSQVSELDRQIKALPQIPDLFVAYANSADGTIDFSRVKPSENLFTSSLIKLTDNINYDGNNDVFTMPDFIRDNIINIRFQFFASGNRYIKESGISDAKVGRLSIKLNVPTNAQYVRIYATNGSVTSSSTLDIYVDKSVNKIITVSFDLSVNSNDKYLYSKFKISEDEISFYLPSKSFNYRDSFMKYIGYSVKNSSNSSDYRWEINPEWQRAQLEYEKASMIKNSIDNLISDGDFSKNGIGWALGSQTRIVDGHLVKSSATSRSYIDIESNGLSKIYVIADIWTEHSMNRVSLNIFDKGGYANKRMVGDTTNTVATSVSNIININNGCRLDLSMSGYANYSACLDNVKIYNLTSIFGTGNEPSLEEFERLLAINVNSPTIYGQSVSKAKLNASPINSILTTLSAENPSTTLGGTWTQLGTETKFSNTIYYWKRTK